MSFLPFSFPMIYFRKEDFFKKTMDEMLLKKLSEQEKKIDAIYVSVEKTRKYFLFTLILSVVLFVLPFFGLLFAVPFLLSTFSGLIGI